jgi:hypothetical protein
MAARIAGFVVRARYYAAVVWRALLLRCMCAMHGSQQAAAVSLIPRLVSMQHACSD